MLAHQRVEGGRGWEEGRRRGTTPVLRRAHILIPSFQPSQTWDEADAQGQRTADSLAAQHTLDCIFTRPAPGHRTGPAASKPAGQVLGLVGAGHVPAAADERR